MTDKELPLDKEDSDMLKIPVWVCTGAGMMCRRDTLPSDHPESTHNYVKYILGKTPENYGL